MSSLQAFARLVTRRGPAAALSGRIAIRGKSSTAHAFAIEPDASDDVDLAEAGPSSLPIKRSREQNSSPKRQATPKGKERERVVFRYEDAGTSMDKRAYFSGEDTGAELGVWGDADGGEGDIIPGLEPGRVIECRRSGGSAIGLLLAAVVANGRKRLILLRQSGEIWPISPNDVQFVMPPSLIPLSLAEQCWSPDVIEAWAKGDESVHNEAADGEMMAARREAVVILRKVARETEKMVGRLSSGEGVEGVWKSCVEGKNPEERQNITAALAADILLSSASQGGGTAGGKTTKTNTLPAYAAHTMLMRRADLFLGDGVDMWDSGIFLVRSPAERKRLETVTRWVDDTTPEDSAILQSFVHKCQQALTSQTSSSPPSMIEWSPTDQTLISTLLSRLYETRTTQHSPYDRLSVAIIRAIDPYPGAIADQATIARLLIDLGCLPVTDSLHTSKTAETELREISQSQITGGLHVPHDSKLSQGTELDSLREDFSSHTVWVIDDPTARELDDGISIVPVVGSEDIWAHIHIADPTKILPIDHPLSVRASFRGTALYLPEGNTPLIPRGEMGEMMQDLSLGAVDGQGGQGVMTFSALLSPSGEIKETAVRAGWIKKPRLTSYEAVDAAFGAPRLTPIRPFGQLAHSPSPSSQAEPQLARPPISAAEIPQLELLQKLAIARRSRRLQSSGLEYSLALGTPSLISPPAPNPNIFAPNSIPSQTSPFPSSPLIDYTIPPPRSSAMTASSAVAEMMMLAGRVAAVFCSTHGIPVPYRGGDAPQQLHIPGRPTATMSLEDLLSQRQPDGFIDPYIVWRSRVVFPSSTVGVDPIPHWNMGFTGSEAGYTRPTSPLRRYDDFIVHWQIKSFLTKQGGVDWGRSMDRDEVRILTNRVSAAQLRGRRAMKNAEAYWQAGLFAQRLQTPRDVNGEGEVDLREPLLGRIAGPSAAMRGMLTTPVHVPALGAMVRMTSTRAGEIGEEVKVRMESAVQWPAPVVVVVPA